MRFLDGQAKIIDAAATWIREEVDGRPPSSPVVRDHRKTYLNVTMSGSSTDPYQV